ncbi:hypothetical protein PVAP13_1NG399000 [Panicum virgatum]|uniref:Uncharacterized protein n=1 Tax=Panicum virgatum TaxID=38727 RepID=A0A8T0X0G4_PANVG|nr:hypothetical protein PVAP13_1NG399000 [Panicum virgatum]
MESLEEFGGSEHRRRGFRAPKRPCGVAATTAVVHGQTPALQFILVLRGELGNWSVGDVVSHGLPTEDALLHLGSRSGLMTLAAYA